MGFRVSGQYLSPERRRSACTAAVSQKGAGIDLAKFYGSDQAVADVERAKLNDPTNVLGRIQAHPVTRSGALYIASGENLTNDSVDVLDIQPE